jgi:hypothetical protein
MPASGSSSDLPMKRKQHVTDRRIFRLEHAGLRFVQGSSIYRKAACGGYTHLSPGKDQDLLLTLIFSRKEAGIPLIQ